MLFKNEKYRIFNVKFPIGYLQTTVNRYSSFIKESLKTELADIYSFNDFCDLNGIILTIR